MRHATAARVARPPLPAPERRRLRAAALLWVLFAALVVATTVGRSPERQSVITHYRAASHAWLAGEPLYGEGREHGFLYLPSFAVLHVPFAALPFRWGGALWRVANLAVLAIGLRRLTRALGEDRAGSLLLLASLFAVGWSAARHGQATIAMAGTMLAAAGALRDRRFTEAALWCGLGVAIKPLAIVLVLLAAVSWRGFRLRAALGLLGALVFPFLAQAPAYAAEQTSGFVRMLATADHPADEDRFYDLLALLDLGLPSGVAWAVRAAAGLVVLVVFLRVRRRSDDRVGALFLYALSAAYLLWFNPRTEHNTFALIVPALGLSFAWALLARRCRFAVLSAALAVWIWVDHDLTTLLLGDQLPWSKPLLLAVALGVLFLHSRAAGWRMALSAPTGERVSSGGPGSPAG